MQLNLNKVNKNWLIIALLFFISIALMGLLMRFSLFSTLIHIEYANYLQAHSHVAFVGWVNLALITGMTAFFLNKDDASSKKYTIINYSLLAIILGMLIGFPIQGYGLVPIASLILYLIIMYFFIYYFLRDSKKAENTDKISLKFIRWGLFYFILSSIGPWSLGPIIALGYKKTEIYYLGIYYYLHFTYNGFFTFTIFGLLYRYLSLKKINFSEKYAKRFFVLLNIAVIPTYALSTLWIEPNISLYIIGILGAAIQVIGLYYLYKSFDFKGLKTILKPIAIALLTISLISFGLKLLTQLVSGFPIIAKTAYEFKHFTIIGYLHLVLLGFISSFLLGFFGQIKGFNIDNQLAKIGLWSFVLGFIGSETVIALGFISSANGNLINNYYPMVFGISILMFLGLLLLLFGQIKTSESK